MTGRDMRRVISEISSRRAREDPSACIIALNPLLNTEEGRRFLSGQEGERALILIELFDWALRYHGIPLDTEGILWALRQLCARQETLPESCILPIGFETSNPRNAAGGFADVWKGTYEGKQVAFKTIRANVMTDGAMPLKCKRKFFKEVVLWKSLDHPNILGLIGVCRWEGSPDARLTMVSEWMANGNIIEYIYHNESQRMKLLIDCARGVQHLHHMNIVHGDLKGANILITSDDPARACLADFGFMTVIYDDVSGLESTSTQGGGTTPFMAPELLCPSMFGKTKCQVSKEADVYAFGMVILQVLTGVMPFHTLLDTEVSYKVIQGERPALPTNAEALGISEELRQLLTRCWFAEYIQRPPIDEILQHLSNNPAQGLKFPPSRVPRASSRGSYAEPGKEEHGMDGITTTSTETPDNDFYEYSSSETLNPKYLFSVEAREGTPATTPGNSRVGIKESIPPVYEMVHAAIGGSKVRIRRMRIYPEEYLQNAETILHEVAATWKQLVHRNVAPLLDFTVGSSQLVLDWLLDEDVRSYVTNHPDADRLNLVLDVAEGLSYLHSRGVILGNLKGPNILVDASSCARITEIGLSVVTQNPLSMRDASVGHCDDARWTAPEILISDDRGIRSKESDIFSFAIVITEVFTGAIPFGSKPSHEVMKAIIAGERPQRPIYPTLEDGLWALTQRCWNQEAHQRPNASDIVTNLDVPAWKRLTKRLISTDERVSLITSIFSDHDEAEAVKRLRGDDAQSFIDAIDEMFNLLTPRLRRKCLGTLRKTCSRQALLPRSVQIPLCYDRLDNPLYRGGYADVWKGEYRGCPVAVKALRVSSTSDFDKIMSRFYKEVVTWKTLHHPNVLPLLGVTTGNYQFALTSEWMENGNINTFIENREDVNRFELLKDVATGLIYMHNQGIIHGDLKGANVLIDQHGHARLADFGILTIVSDPENPMTSSSTTNVGMIRWMSPELIDPDQFGVGTSRPTIESDCYALGMVILEALTGEIPYKRFKDIVVMRMVIGGKRPERPEWPEGAWFTEDIWDILEKCWSPQPKDRPSVGAVLELLGYASKAWRPLTSAVEHETPMDTDEMRPSMRYPSALKKPQDNDQLSISIFLFVFFFFGVAYVLPFIRDVSYYA